MSDDTVILPATGTYWYHITQEQLEAIRRQDIEEGNTYDAGGEPRIYTALRSGYVKDHTLVTITRRRGVPWNSWRTKPRHLVEGLATIDGVPKVIIFQCPPRQRGANRTSNLVR